MNAIQQAQQQRRISAGFADPVHDAQQAFRAALAALSRPGRLVDLGREVAGLQLQPAMAHLLLAMADDDCAVWWQADDAGLPQWLRFHTGATRTAVCGDALFAVVTDAMAMPALGRFAQGTAASPEFSTTLLVEVPSLVDGPGLQWRGPGIRDAATVRVAGLPPAFWLEWQANHAGFPQGVDLFFTCGAQALGLPRTTSVGRPQEV